MAKPTTRAEFKTYCLRRLGFPVIEINVDDDQVDDRIDDALAFFNDYHYDGTEKIFMKHRITQEDIDRRWIHCPDAVTFVTNVFPFDDSNSSINMFDLRYQLRLNDLYDFTSTSFTHYYIIMQQLSQIDFLLVGKKPVRFTQSQNRLYIDMDWRNDIAAGKFLIIDCFKALDPDDFTKIYNHLWVKDYCTQMIKKYWGQNMIKYEGVQLPGGVTLNGPKIYDDAVNELEKLDKQLRDQYELPPLDMIG